MTLITQLPIKSLAAKVFLGFGTMLLVGWSAIAPNSASAQYIVDRQNLTIRDDADRLLNLGKLQAHQGQPKKAFQSWQQAIDRYRLVNDQAAIALTLSIMGVNYAENKFNDHADETLRLRMGYANTLGQPLGKIATFNNLATNSLISHNRADAEDFSGAALGISRKYENNKGTAIALSTIGQLAAKRGDHLRAIKLYYQAIPYRYPIADDRGVAYTLIHRGDSFMKLREYKNAIADYGQALVLSKTTRNIRLQALVTERLIPPYLELPNYYRAEDLLISQTDLAIKLGDLHTAIIAQRHLGDLHLSLGNPAKAKLAYERSLDIAAKLEDSLAIKEAALRLQTLERLN